MCEGEEMCMSEFAIDNIHISILLVLLLQIVNVRRPYVRGRKGACRNLQVMEPYPETLLWFCIAMHFEPAAVTFLF